MRPTALRLTCTQELLERECVPLGQINHGFVLSVTTIVVTYDIVLLIFSLLHEFHKSIRYLGGISISGR